MRYRVDHRIVDLPHYSRGQTTERLYLNGTRTDTSRCKQLAPFAIAERFIIAKTRRTRLSYRLLKTSYYSERNYGSSMEEGTKLAGEYSNKGDIYFTRMHASNAMNGGKGQDASKKTYSRYLLITYMHL